MHRTRMEPSRAPAAGLDAEFIAAQKDKLSAERNTLERDLSRIARKDPVGHDYHARFEEVGRAQDENVHEEEQYEVARSAEQSLEVQLREVNAALQRITDGTYGLCTTCQSSIDRRRLEALPSATTCVRHAS